MTNTAKPISLPALQAGDKAEFARLVDTHSTAIYRLGLRMLGDKQDAEDILQNTFMKAFQHIAKFEGRSSISTWLYRIAANEALMLVRKRKPETLLSDARSEEDDEDFTPLQVVDWSCLPEDELMTTEARLHMEQAIQRLPETLRIVFLLRDIEGLSIQDTCQALNLSETAVKTRLLRARLRLRERLSQYYGERIRERNADDAQSGPL